MALSAVEILQLAINNLPSFNPGNAVIATAVALAESGGNPNATNTKNKDGSIDSGLWQINSVHKRDHPTWTVDWLHNPNNNAKAMSIISKGGTYWKPWTVYNNGDYKKHIPAAQKALESIRETPGIGEQIADTIPGVSEVADVATTVASTVATVTRWVTNPDNMLRIAQVVGGIALALIGAAIVANNKVVTK